MGSVLENIFFSLAEIAEPFGILITWLFVFTFLYNLSAAINKPDNSRTQLSFIMMISYSLNLYIDAYTPSVHLQLFAFDVVTIVVIFIWRLYFGKVIPIGFYYLIVGLTINATLFMALYIESIVKLYDGYWWLWGVYGSVMPLVDLIMAVVLIANKDFLGVVKLKNSMLNRKTQAVM
ncbi:MULTISPECIES: hypothetical protein [unclassified Pseudoalteromonas]|uniref:hypothetical protein n=1 Tax=unclassified Pseudoalteromonas TaxID=194690 RepID=UPI0007309141|nr:MULTISPECIES: hypothetical protein [unclassified Pseudoalteromonas]KTD95622.1 hypothetical protein ATS71_04915 [Pseudoalteromonas sp. H71]TMN80567.1 hypothetical protein CWB64_12895 [Pseudoalteromonas sp. S410]TMN89848.1 hypothetical protein CWB62_12435 [Pseudoalteromonas sp. S408]TMN97685.1 hypothetical protein CWB61_09230 [Pseudoalteromonas sp. S407]TMO02155.1 hypothetical protein CWB63_02045 [Pseudoalteromonas sp. S409]